jgi:hypothetical protein
MGLQQNMIAKETVHFSDAGIKHLNAILDV